MTDIYVSHEGSDLYDGLTEMTPKKTFDNLPDYSRLLLRRGDTFHTKPTLRGGCTYTAYGNPEAPVPFFDIHGTVFTLSKSNTGIAFSKLGFRNFYLPFYMFGGKRITIEDVEFEDGLDDRNCIYFKASEDITVKGIKCKRTAGDVVYGTASRRIKVTDCDGYLPSGGKADFIQFTHEGKDGFVNDDVLIANNKIRLLEGHSLNSKGAIAVEGTHDFQILDNDVEGRFFGIQAAGKRGVVKGNIIGKLGLDSANVFGIGVGAPSYAEDIEFTDNKVANCLRGFIISDPSRSYQRDNIRIFDNLIVDCKKPIVTDVPYTGIIEPNEIVFTDAPVQSPMDPDKVQKYIEIHTKNGTYNAVVKITGYETYEEAEAILARL